MTDAEPSFVDTNILLAATDTDRSGHANSQKLLGRGLNGELRLFACGQILREYLVVATRPVENNGLGLTPEKALDNIQSFRRCIRLLDENDATTRRLEALIAASRLKAKRIHDANIVSIMIENGLHELFTLNPDDFKPFPTIITRQP